MTCGLRTMIFGLCIVSLIAFRADAQQILTGNNPHKTHIRQLKQEMQELHQQLAELRLQSQQLMTQLKAVREKTHSIEIRLKVDGEQLRAIHEGQDK